MQGWKKKKKKKKEARTDNDEGRPLSTPAFYSQYLNFFSQFRTSRPTNGLEQERTAKAWKVSFFIYSRW